MTIRNLHVLLFALIGTISIFIGNSQSEEEGVVKILKGTYTPMYTNTEISEGQVSVNSFYIDKYPVTNEDFLDFIKSEFGKKWKKSKATALFVDENYLSNWENDITLKPSILRKSPVTNVSWFAAKSYCEYKGGRLPTIREWEYVALADETKPNATGDSLYVRKILAWYEAPSTVNKEVGQAVNYWGVYDLFGLVWEWTSDFNSIIISGDSRKKGDLNKKLFCGGSIVGASDLLDYAAFARYAFRGSLEPKYAIRNLGFRCACDDVENKIE
ncbi:formylglycine-generating enzyme family protein [uncultured Croceitalea sp.]|uniref:formylglycine-generating enzyme family protein n=1 Tax=uncultured Croceitalea sp. TaxID=1798908 RepID=UPI00374E7145